MHDIIIVLVLQRIILFSQVTDVRVIVHIGCDVINTAVLHVTSDFSLKNDVMMFHCSILNENKFVIV